MKKYDICISYITDDYSDAKRLFDSISAYKLPSDVVLDGELSYKNIYMDDARNPFDDEVKSVFDDSRFLVILCSPDAKMSEEINSRLSYFMDTYGRNQVIAVLCEGEPVDSFPERFIEEKEVEHILPDMTVVKRIETVEPVASDLRGDSDEKINQLLKYETVRIVASVLEMHPDELERRHEKRRQNRIKAIVSLVAAVRLVVSGIFIVLGLRARNEGNIAQKQTEQAVSVSERLIDELPRQFSDNDDAQQIISEIIDETQSELAEKGMDYLLKGED